jgi:hypothetical protein
MILARLTQAVRQQNWFAVVLEFIIVIAGVVIGFQVTAWNEGRTNQVRVDQAIERLQLEAEQSIAALRQRIASSEARATERAVMVDVAAGGELANANQAAFERAVAQLMYFSQIPVQRSTYQALEQSGDLALITNSDLIIELNRYQERVDWVESQHAGFRRGLTSFSGILGQFVFHEPTDDPTRTRARIDLDLLAADARRRSALVQMARMHSIFDGYVVTLEAYTMAFCDRLAVETGRACNVEENSS